TTILWPSRQALITRLATLAMRSALATEVPPYFWTIRDTAEAPELLRYLLYPNLVKRKAPVWRNIPRFLWSPIHRQIKIPVNFSVDAGEILMVLMKKITRR